jgi:hypothetical protein
VRISVVIGYTGSVYCQRYESDDDDDDDDVLNMSEETGAR